MQWLSIKVNSVCLLSASSICLEVCSTLHRKLKCNALFSYFALANETGIDGAFALMAAACAMLSTHCTAGQ